MNSVQSAILPGFLLGSLFVIFISALVANPQMVIASDGLTNLVASGSSVIVQLGSFSEILPFDSSQTSPEALITPPTTSVEVVPTVEATEKAASSHSEQKNETSGCEVSVRYPESILQWCGLIQKHARENGLDPNLIAAIILQESNGNPQAYSHSGAVGLMQVMPRDGIAAGFWCSSGPCFAGRPSMDELYDPEFNIAYGTHMFAGLVQKHGNVRDALRAYGPTGWGYGYADKVLAIYDQYR